MGMPGTGKTRYAEALTASAFRVIYFSPVPDYYREGRLWCTVAHLERWRGLLDDPHARIVIDLEHCNGGKAIARELVRLLALIREATRQRGAGGFVWVLDEVGDYKEHAEDELISIFRRARHNRTAVILASQCATDFPYRCRKMASRVACFGQEHEGELAELKRTYKQQFVDEVDAWNPSLPPAEWRSKHFQGRWSDA